VLHPSIFISLLKEVNPADDRTELADFALHLLFDAHAYPFDLSRLLKLQQVNFLLARGVLNYCLVEPACIVYFSEDSLKDAFLFSSDAAAKGHSA